MKRVQADSLESIADYRLIEVDPPAPGPGQVLVQVAACGVGYVDALVSLGRYQVKPPLPHTPGQETGGTIEALGDGVTGLTVGDRLKALCEGKGPDVIFDPVCGPLFEAAFRSLAWRGRHLVVGFVGGPIPALPANLTLMKGAALAGVDVRQFMLFEGAKAAAHLAELLGWVGEGRLTPPVGRTFPLEAYAEALEFALTGTGLGKTVLEIS